MFATLVYRDQRRARRGLPAVVTEVPERLGLFTRILLGAGSLVALGTGVRSSIAGGWSAWEAVVGLLLLAVVLAYAAVTGRFPTAFLLFLGAKERRS